MEELTQNTKRLTTEKEIIVLKAIKELLQIDDVDGFETILKEMYRACLCSDHYDDAEERTRLVCHFEYLIEFFEGIRSICPFKDIFPKEH